MSFGCVVMIVGSATLEITGLGLVAVDLWRVQRREFGLPRWMQKLRRAVRRALRKPPVVHQRSASLSSSFKISGRVSKRLKTDPEAPLEQRISTLEFNLGQLEDDMQERFTTVNTRVSNAQRGVDEIEAALDRMQRDQKDEKLAELRQAMPTQWIGTGLFAIGALLGMWANLGC